MTTYGRQRRGPHAGSILETREADLIWSQDWTRPNAPLGDAFNADPDPVTYPNTIAGIDHNMGALTVLSQRDINGPGEDGSMYPRGRNFLIPDWLQGPNAIPPAFPNAPPDGIIEEFRLMVIYTRLRFWVNAWESNDPFSEPNPSVDFFLGPESYVGDQANPFPFGLVCLRPDYNLLAALSADAPPATWSTSAQPPSTGASASWVGRPGALSMEIWQNGPLQSAGEFAPLWGDSIYLRIVINMLAKAPTQVIALVFASPDASAWRLLGQTFFDTTLLDPVATGLRRLGLAVRGVAYGALDFIRLYSVQVPAVTSFAALDAGDPFILETGIPPLGGRFYEP